MGDHCGKPSVLVLLGVRPDVILNKSAEVSLPSKVILKRPN
jgi:hypothetical protein